MKLPDRLMMKESAHGHGDKGLAFYTYADTEGVGVIRDVRRESARHQFVESWRFRWLPNQVFPSFPALAAAVESLTDEQVAVEKARWPVLDSVADITGKDWPNRCWRHRDRNAAVQASVHTCWIAGEGLICSLCAECGEHIDAGGVVKVVEERRRAVAMRRQAERGEPAR